MSKDTIMQRMEDLAKSAESNIVDVAEHLDAFIVEKWDEFVVYVEGKKTSKPEGESAPNSADAAPQEAAAPADDSTAAEAEPNPGEQATS